MTLEIDRHEVVGLIGPNGAGKTTLINLITGFDLPSSGTVDARPGGRHAVAGQPPRARADWPGPSSTATVRRPERGREVQLGALGIGIARRRGAGDVLRAARCARAARPGRRARGGAPHGEEQKVSVARALASRPRYVLLDEPAAGLSDSDLPSFAALVRRVRDEYGAGVLLVDHNMALIMECATGSTCSTRGARSPPARRRRSARNIDVAAAYLGSSGVTKGSRCLSRRW